VAMELPEMETWRGENEDGRSHFRFVLNGQKMVVKYVKRLLKQILNLKWKYDRSSNKNTIVIPSGSLQSLFCPFGTKRK